MSEWQPIETAPWNKWVLCWWTPVDGNPWAETVIVAQVMAPDDPYADDAKPTKYWDGHLEGPIELLTHWMPRLPAQGPNQEEYEMSETVDGWTKWTGGICPVPRGSVVDFLRRSGELVEGVDKPRDLQLGQVLGPAAYRHHRLPHRVRP